VRAGAALRALTPAREDVGAAGLTMIAVLGSLASAMLLRERAGLSVEVPVLAVVLTLTLSRVGAPGPGEMLTRAVETPLLALAAAGVGRLIRHDLWLGQTLLVVGLSVGILARRYGPAVRAVGRLVALPFLALLVTPLPRVTDAAESSPSLLWVVPVALIAVAWTTGVSVGARALHRTTGEGTSEGTTGKGTTGKGTTGAVPPRAGGPPRRRLDAPTRMAAQMATGLAAASVAGHLLFGPRWAWTLLSAYLVASGNRSRGDVVHKAGLRVVGALFGTLGATLVGGALPSGHRSTLVALFVVMAVAMVLRRRSYAWWAGGVTAMVALLHAYYGQAGAGALGERLLGVLVGSAIGVGAAWFVLPVRTGAVFRRRVADCLAVLTDDLKERPGGEPSPRLVAALDRLDEITPAFRVGSHLPFDRSSAACLAAVEALHELAGPTDPAARSRLRGAVVRVRRSMVGRDDPAPEELPPPLATVHRALTVVGSPGQVGGVRVSSRVSSPSTP
jgi:Fusaric acid resistance protein-like